MLKKGKSNTKNKTKNSTIKKSNKTKFVRWDAKASVFTHLFSIPKYMKELYVYLHPEDKNISENELRVYTISNIFTNSLINDMGILARNTMIILAEAQSHWSINILPRSFEYLAETYNRYIHDTNQSIYGTKKVMLPKPELYVISTDDKEIKQKEISFQKEFFNGEDCAVEIKIKVITLKNAGKIVKEYIKFTKQLDKNNKLYGYKRKSIVETVDYCIKHNILKEYLIEHKKEVYNIMTSIYDQKTATEMYGREQYAEGKAEGMQQGMQQGIQQGMQQGMQQGIQQGMQQGIQQGMQQGKLEGSLNAIISLFKKKLLALKDAANELNMTEKEFLQLIR